MTDGQPLVKEFTKIVPPFTPQQVACLTDYQHRSGRHPFTCPRKHGRSTSLLVGPDGWTCPSLDCDYTQNWAWADMADRSWDTMWPTPQPWPKARVLPDPDLDFQAFRDAALEEAIRFAAGQFEAWDLATVPSPDAYARTAASYAILKAYMPPAEPTGP